MSNNSCIEVLFDVIPKHDSSHLEKWKNKFEQSFFIRFLRIMKFLFSTNLLGDPMWMISWVHVHRKKTTIDLSKAKKTTCCCRRVKTSFSLDQLNFMLSFQTAIFYKSFRESSIAYYYYNLSRIICCIVLSSHQLLFFHFFLSLFFSKRVYFSLLNFNSPRSYQQDDNDDDCFLSRQ